jgi:hypothetical protein
LGLAHKLPVATHRGIQLGVAGWAAVAGALELVTCLTCLNGCGHYAAIRAGGLQTMTLSPEWELAVWAARFLERSASTLTMLDVRDNGLDPASATVIGTALAEVTSLTLLDLRRQDVGDGVWPVLAALLPRTAQLQVTSGGDMLVVSGVGGKGTSRMTLSGGKGLGPDGAQRLADLLCEAPPPMLAEIDLRENELGVAGWAAVADALERVTSLTSLNGCDEYASIRAGGLTAMKLGGTELGVWAARFLKQSGSTLTTLDLRCQ